MLQTIQNAQSEAQGRGVAVVLCQSRNQIACGGQWIEGFMVFMNDEQDGKVRGNKNILKTVKPSLKTGTLFYRSYPYYRDYLVFQPHLAWHNNNSTFWYCPTQPGKPAWAVIVNRTGRVRTVYPNKTGLIKDSQGRALAC